jgi:4-diphosphocytidyl-2-C-methyl-D-erythritol kinase
MDLRRDDLTRIALAPAKLNLYLDLLGRRDDGFHEVETVMVPIRLADTVSFRPLSAAECSTPGEVRLNVRACAPLGANVDLPAIPTGPENLVVRAVNLLRERSGCELGAAIELVKRVPSAAGLGGGSSDAAAALRLANVCWRLGWTSERLTEVAAAVGSDVPFFLTNGAAICRGRGERVERLRPIAPIHVVIVKPRVGLDTGDVYRAYAAQNNRTAPTSTNRSSLSNFVASLQRSSPQRVGRVLHNALQSAASSLANCIGKIEAAFNELDFIGHQLTGSGTAYFGICRHARHARRLADILRLKQLGLVYATCTYA